MTPDPELGFYGSTTDHSITLPSEDQSIKTEPMVAEAPGAMRLSDFAVLTMDCYGTLVDRETGIVNALMPWLRDVGVSAGRGEILRAFGQAERARLAEAPSLLYRDVLAHVHDALAEFFGVPADRTAAAAFASSVKDWPVHSDVPGALAYLKEHFQLVVLTNADHASFMHTSEKLGVALDAVYTAEDVGSYKPDVRNFEYLQARLDDAGISRDRALHVAGSIRFDHVPAKRVGMKTCWIHRPHHRSSNSGLRCRDLNVRPDFHFESLGALADAYWADVGSA